MAAVGRVSGQRRAAALLAALEGPQPHLGRFEVDVFGPQRERF